MRRRQFLVVLTALMTPGAVLAQNKPRSVSVEEAHQKVSDGQMVLIDVRTPREWAETGTAKGAVRIEMEDAEFLKKLNDLRTRNPGREVALICRTGNRSGVVQEALARAGYADTINVRGGMSGTPRDKGWLAASLPVEK